MSQPGFNVIFQDNELLVIDKPALLVTTPAETIQTKTLSEMVGQEFGIKLDRSGLVHRLDKDTSGVIIFAKTQASLENLQAQFKDRTTKKEYISLIHGRLEQPLDVVGAIERNPKDREKFIVTATGKEAETIFKPIKHLVFGNERLEQVFAGFNKIQMRKLARIHYPEFTLISAQPLTGRTHQIRVHLKHQGFSIVSDEKYGGRKVVRLDKRWCQRMFLHAASLEISHPKTGKRQVFESHLPDDLEKALSYLKEF